MAWSLHPAVRDDGVRLDELVALYHPASGETHLLASPALAVIDALRRGTASTEELVAASELTEAQAASELLALLDAGLVVPS